MAKNTSTGIRYLCGKCAHSDGREIVKEFPSRTGGPCANCGTTIERGEYTFVLDSGIRKGRKEITPLPPGARPKDLTPLMELHRKIVGRNT